MNIALFVGATFAALIVMPLLNMFVFPLIIGYAYEQATPWHSNHPAI